MCIKNVNTNVVFFENVIPNETNGKQIDLIGISKDYPVVYAERKEDNLLNIKRLDIILLVNAIEKIDNNKNPLHGNGETSLNTFFMDERYKIRLRVTETHSGNFFDLDTISVVPSEKMVTLCRRIYSQKCIYQYKNVLVSTPPTGKDLCVLKVLIQNEAGPDKWIVQSIHPMKIVVKE